ncbi:glycosyltransferase family 39 protein [Ulvibacter antarcticus]|uniref:4-amino-4-deoxy-L-arabinose transferase-like glycosyltransferase n=1 Tax=Ulvibacter antarcticus TaxID=442714 RepID=A0A3L9YB15_9FLAO|nr:glycosyltransferase family 39 protein [Ulvibacter antarcticus]RMA57923.1 4-amino-4-deoxy-L-arabinose transferase-like glycosyltransferase [Ulvibacter antarcticus]
MQAINKNHLLLLLLTCVAIFFVNLDALPVNIMEARNFTTAREMLQDGHWLLTTLNGEARYQKPPMPTWLTAFSAAIFGIKSVAAMRLPAALITLILVLVSYKLSEKITQNKSYAFISSLVLATSFYIVASGRDGQWDIYTHGFMMVCIFQLYLLFSQEKRKYLHALLAAVFFGCSFLSKGPVSFYALLLPFLIAYGVVYKYKKFKSRVIPLVVFLAVALVLSGWWHWYTYTYDPITVAQITERETSNWTGYNVRPFYYYWSFFIQSGIWTIPAFISLLYPYLKSRVFNKKAYLFTFLWTMGSVILLSLIPEKKSRYLLPVLIPMALNIGFYIEYLIRKFADLKDKRETIPVYFNFGLIAIIGLIFPIAGYIFLKDGLEGSWIRFAILAIVLFCIGFFMLRNLFRRKILPVFYLTIAFIASVTTIGLPLVSAITINDEYKPLSLLNDWQASENLKVYEFTYFTPELIWDYGDEIEVLAVDGKINIPSEKRFGLLVGEEETEKFKEVFSAYTIEKITRYDMNPQGKEHRSHKTRLYRDLYLLQK